MKTGIIAVALMLAWSGISGLASAQAHGSTLQSSESLAVTRPHGQSGSGESGATDTEVGAERMVEWLGTIDAIRNDLERNEGFIRSDDELVLALLFHPMEGEAQLLQQYMKSVVVAMESVPEPFYDRLDEKIEGLWSEIRRLAPTFGPVTGTEVDGVIKRAIEARVAQGAPESKVVRAVMSSENWTARMSDMGLPRSEYKRGYVVYRLPDQPLVVCQQIIVERPYFGVASRPADYTIRLGYLRLQSAS